MSVSSISKRLELKEQDIIKCLDTKKNRELSVLYDAGGVVAIKNVEEILEKYFNYSSLVFMTPTENKQYMVPFDREPRVYFLMQGDYVSYVGQTMQLAGRIASHVQSKKFDSVAWIDTHDNDLDLVESFNISFYAPSGNISIPNKLDLFRMVVNSICF